MERHKCRPCTISELSHRFVDETTLDVYSLVHVLLPVGILGFPNDLVSIDFVCERHFERYVIEEQSPRLACVRSLYLFYSVVNPTLYYFSRIVFLDLSSVNLTSWLFMSYARIVCPVHCVLPFLRVILLLHAPRTLYPLRSSYRLGKMQSNMRLFDADSMRLRIRLSASECGCKNQWRRCRELMSVSVRLHEGFKYLYSPPMASVHLTICICP